MTKLEDITTPVVKDGETGFLVEGNDNIPMFVDRISYLYHHRQELERMREQTALSATQNYSAENMGKHYHDLILRLVG